MGRLRFIWIRYSEEVREKIIEAQQPLGGILNEHQIPYGSTPRGFLRVVPDGPIVEAFSEVESDHLYGRSNQITGMNQQVIARIVEILPVREHQNSLENQCKVN